MKKIAFSIIALIALALVVAGSLCYFFFPPPIDIADAEAVYLETVDKNKQIKRVKVTAPQDVQVFKETLSGKTVRDDGFVFAEGGYRIVFVKPGKNLVLYPYCGGDLSMMRVGESGQLFCGPEENSQAYTALEKTLGNYIDLDKYDGIWSWK